MSPYYVIPIAVLILQTLLLVLSWTFFAITLTNPVPLSVKNAINVSEHMQSVTMTMTLIASSISLVSAVCVQTFFFVSIKQLNKVWNRTVSILVLYDTLWRVSLLPRCLYMQFSGRLRWPTLLRSKILQDQPGRSQLFYPLLPLMHKLLGMLYHGPFELLTDGLSRYTTLLTPKYIVVKSKMVGYELDLKSFGFQNLMETNAQRVTAGKVVA